MTMFFFYRFILKRGGKSISVEEKTRKEMKYLVTLSMLRKIYEIHHLDIKLLEQLNRMNAKHLGCQVIPIQLN